MAVTFRIATMIICTDTGTQNNEWQAKGLSSASALLQTQPFHLRPSPRTSHMPRRWHCLPRLVAPKLLAAAANRHDRRHLVCLLCTALHGFFHQMVPEPCIFGMLGAPRFHQCIVRLQRSSFRLFIARSLLCTAPVSPTPALK